MVTGMTGCRNTTWVSVTVENKSSTINPIPQGIVWCYSRWQQAYTEMIQTIPEIEFVKGNPFDLERREKLIVIDEQMATASHNNHIINLFYTGFPSSESKCYLLQITPESLSSR